VLGSPALSFDRLRRRRLLDLLRARRNRQSRSRADALVFIVAGIFFLTTSLTYAEGTVRSPRRRSSSFARHAFNEVRSFFAGLGPDAQLRRQISISAYFVPHYLSGLLDAAEDHALGHRRRHCIIFLLVG